MFLEDLSLYNGVVSGDISEKIKLLPKLLKSKSQTYKHQMNKSFDVYESDNNDIT